MNQLPGMVGHICGRCKTNPAKFALIALIVLRHCRLQRILRGMCGCPSNSTFSHESWVRLGTGRKTSTLLAAPPFLSLMPPGSSKMDSMEAVELKIAKVEKEIEALSSKIEEAEGKIKDAEAASNASAGTKSRALREKEEQLREEKNELRKEKNKLLDEKARLQSGGVSLLL